MDSLIIINPNSGSAKGIEAGEKLQRALEDKGERVKSLVSKSEEDLIQQAKKSCGSFDKLFILGGDGTISKAVGAIIEEENRPQLGIVPCGTVNNFAELLGLSMDIDEAIEDLVRFDARKIDLGKAGDNYFISSLVTGKIPEEVMDVDDDTKAKLGKFAFITKGISSLAIENGDKFTLKLDGEIIEDQLSIILIAVGNSIYRIPSILEDGRMDDGYLNLIALKNTGILEKISQLPEILSSNPNYSENIITRKFKKAEIDTDNRSRKAIADGEDIKTWPLKISLLEASYQVFVGKAFNK